MQIRQEIKLNKRCFMNLCLLRMKKMRQFKAKISSGGDHISDTIYALK